jgi:hypothetical protein
VIFLIKTWGIPFNRAVEKPFSIPFPSFPPPIRSRAGCGGNPGFSRCYWIPVFTGMTNYASRDDFFNKLARSDPRMF